MDNGQARLTGFETALDIGTNCRQKYAPPVGFHLFLAGGFFYGILPAIF